eukprot:gene11059-19917_t
MTSLIDDIPVTKYPCLPGYATTISKVQGQTLPKVVLWLDTDTTPAGTAYVALSRMAYTPTKKMKGVGYFHHFPKNFLKPYRRAEPHPSHNVALSRLRPEGCEWLRQPHVATSELSSTVNDNMPVLMQDDQLLDAEKIQKLTRNLEPLALLLQQPQMTPRVATQTTPTQSHLSSLISILQTASSSAPQPAPSPSQAPSSTTTQSLSHIITALSPTPTQATLPAINIPTPPTAKSSCPSHDSPLPQFPPQLNQLQMAQLLQTYANYLQPPPTTSPSLQQFPRTNLQLLLQTVFLLYRAMPQTKKRKSDEKDQ